MNKTFTDYDLVKYHIVRFLESETESDKHYHRVILDALRKQYKEIGYVEDRS